MPGSPRGQGGPGKLLLTRAEWQVVEVKALVPTLDNWLVVEMMAVPTKMPDRRLISAAQALGAADNIRSWLEATAVFVNVEDVSTRHERTGGRPARAGVRPVHRGPACPHCHARTKEAPLQGALAELPLLRDPAPWTDMEATLAPSWGQEDLSCRRSNV